MKSTTEKIICAVGWIVFIAIVWAVVSYEEDSKYAIFSVYAGRLFSIWIVACFAYIFSASSKHSIKFMLRYLVLFALFMGGYAFVMLGHSSYDDEYDIEMNDSYNPTIHDRCTSAVYTFLNVIVGGAGGIVVGSIVKKKYHPELIHPPK